MQDKLFVRQAAVGGRAEVELGRLAQKKGVDHAVKDFGERMVAVNYSIETLPVVMAHLETAKLEHARLTTAERPTRR